MQALNYQFTEIYRVFIYVWNGYFPKTLLSFVNKLHTSFSNPSLKQIFLKSKEKPSKWQQHVGNFPVSIRFQVLPMLVYM